MPVISKEEAVERLTREVAENLPADEVLEVYNDIFSKDRRSAAEMGADVRPLVERIVAYINKQSLGGIIELWNLIFTIRYCNVGSDVEEEGLYYEEAEKAASSG